MEWLMQAPLQIFQFSIFSIFTWAKFFPDDWILVGFLYKIRTVVNKIEIVDKYKTMQKS